MVGKNVTHANPNANTNRIMAKTFASKDCRLVALIHNTAVIVIKNKIAKYSPSIYNKRRIKGEIFITAPAKTVIIKGGDTPPVIIVAVA